MKEAILKFVEEHVNPTMSEIIAHVEADIRKEIEAFEKTGKLFTYWDNTIAPHGGYRVCNDEGLF